VSYYLFYRKPYPNFLDIQDQFSYEKVIGRILTRKKLNTVTPVPPELIGKSIKFTNSPEGASWVVVDEEKDAAERIEYLKSVQLLAAEFMSYLSPSEQERMKVLANMLVASSKS
jgi:hypothetical protein